MRMGFALTLSSLVTLASLGGWGFESRAESYVNDPLYVPVEFTEIEQRGDGLQVLRLEGEYPYTYIGCMVFESIETQLVDERVLLVEPIGRFTSGDECQSQINSKKFSAQKILPLSLEPGVYLVQVFAPTGGVLNRVVEIDGSPE